MSVSIVAGNQEINLSNANFAAVADALGILGRFPDFYGSISAAELKSLCEAWQGTLQFDAGVEPSKDGIVIDCGRSRGYLNIRVQQILEIAEAGVEQGIDVDFM